MVAFPACGCDACDETAIDDAKRLAELVEDVTAGRFLEGISSAVGGEWFAGVGVLVTAASIFKSISVDPSCA
jgi:hypothetical protein